MLMLFKKKGFSVIKYYKTLISILIPLGSILILLDLFGPDFEHHRFFGGLGTGFLMASSVILLILLYFRRKEHLKEDFELSFQDERLQIQRYKMFTVASFIMIFTVIIMVALSVFYEFSFATGGTILLLIHSASLVILKFYFRNK